MLSYLELCRPQQWVKNLFVLIPLVFARRFWDPELLMYGLAAMFVFILASSSVYVLNDLMDVEKDKLHPDKKKRPLASGRCTERGAWTLWGLLMLMTLMSGFVISWSFFLIVMGYLSLTMAYSLFLKKVLFLDVILISLGFVFRVLGGGLAAEVIVTDWMIVLIFLFTLFLAISKRRQEIKNLEKRSKKTREVLTRYTIDLIDQLNSILVPIVVTSYIFYTFSERENNPFFIATIPLIVYCFFRYLYLLKHTKFGESSSDYLADWQLLSMGGLWFVMVMLGLGI